MAEIERLTKRDELGNADVIGCEAHLFYGVLSFDELITMRDALNLLAAYEDTGLSPDEVTEIADAHTWISVKERLPDSEDEVLVCTRSKNGSKSMDKGYYMSGRWVHRGCAEVTHWMPMPGLPEEG